MNRSAATDGPHISPEEEEPGRNQEIILSYGLWEQRLCFPHPNILKRVIKVDGKSFSVVA